MKWFSFLATTVLIASSQGAVFAKLKDVVAMLKVDAVSLTRHVRTIRARTAIDPMTELRDDLKAVAS